MTIEAINGTKTSQNRHVFTYRRQEASGIPLDETVLSQCVSQSGHVTSNGLFTLFFFAFDNRVNKRRYKSNASLYWFPTYFNRINIHSFMQSKIAVCKAHNGFLHVAMK